MIEKLEGATAIPRLGPFMVSRVGMRKAMRVAGFIASWGIAYEDLHLGRAITIEEYAEYWHVSRAKAFRDQQAFKEVWPRDFSPLRVWKWCRRQVTQTDRDMAAAELWNAKSFA